MRKQNIPLSIATQKQKQLLMKLILMIYVNQFLLQLYQMINSLLAQDEPKLMCY